MIRVTCSHGHHYQMPDAFHSMPCPVCEDEGPLHLIAVCAECLIERTDYEGRGKHLPGCPNCGSAEVPIELDPRVFDAHPRHEMTASEVRDWTLSDDGRELVIERDGPMGGTITTRLAWKPRVTPEQLRTALTTVPTFADDQTEAEKRFGRMWHTKRGEWFYFFDKGPPTWWLPRFSLERWGFRCGWFRVAIAFAWKKRAVSGESREADKETE